MTGKTQAEGWQVPKALLEELLAGKGACEQDALESKRFIKLCIHSALGIYHLSAVMIGANHSDM